MALTPEQVGEMQQALDKQPDWGGAQVVYTGEEAAPADFSIEDALKGDLVRWNGALWLFVAFTGEEATEMWLAPLAGVRKRPMLVLPDDGVLSQPVELNHDDDDYDDDDDDDGQP